MSVLQLEHQRLIGWSHPHRCRTTVSVYLRFSYSLLQTLHSPHVLIKTPRSVHRRFEPISVFFLLRRRRTGRWWHRWRWQRGGRWRSWCGHVYSIFHSILIIFLIQVEKTGPTHWCVTATSAYMPGSQIRVCVTSITEHIIEDKLQWSRSVQDIPALICFICISCLAFWSLSLQVFESLCIHSPPISSSGWPLFPCMPCCSWSFWYLKLLTIDVVLLLCFFAIEVSLCLCSCFRWVVTWNFFLYMGVSFI